MPRITGHILLILSALVVLSNTVTLTDRVSDPFLYGFLPLATAVVIAVFLLRKDSTPQTGLIFFTAALVNSAVQLWGGALGPAAFLYPLFFLWMKRDSIGGPILTIAGVLAAVEFIAPVVSSTGIKSGTFDLSSFLSVLRGALIAGIIPLVSMSAVEYLKEEKSSADTFSRNSHSRTKETSPLFPDDVARSLIPILKAGTGAHGIFLFIRDRRKVWTLNEFVTDSGSVSGRYMAGPDDPVIQMLNESSGDVVHARADRLSIGGTPGLPWYIQAGGSPWVTLVQFRRNGVLSGFMVLDYDSEEKRKRSSSILVDSVFLLSISWELGRKEKDNGFLAICEEMEASRDIRGAVHKLIGRIISSYSGTTVTVAIVNTSNTLAIFESRGPFGAGRAGREFHVNDGFAGLAVSRRQPLRRLRMGAGRTFGERDDPRSVAGSCCAVPLEDRGESLGVLTVESASEQFFSLEDLSVFKAYATIFSLAVSRNHLLSSIRKLREIDRLTGLPLLSSFHEQLADLIRGVRSRALSIAVLAVDIKGFTGINEDLGYTAGDTVLRKTAKRLQKALGEKAVLARYGPDGFLVCLTGVDRVSAEAFAARIHEEFAHKPLKVSGREIELQVCIGGAVSHVDRMILKLPQIAVNTVEKISSRPGCSAITEVGPFFKQKG
ncbi:MAG: sensor domain-containing diguanylate cyclase [Candidatus Sabulitectum sp.]|nr:sensor domain-containing diguanylate cyclase [Candidatus Sabulitectum sp.]